MEKLKVESGKLERLKVEGGRFMAPLADAKAIKTAVADRV